VSNKVARHACGMTKQWIVRLAKKVRGYSMTHVPELAILTDIVSQSYKRMIKASGP